MGKVNHDEECQQAPERTIANTIKKLYRDTIVPTALKNKSAIVKENTNVIKEIVHVNDGGINTNSMRRQ